ncbi:MAG: phage holin family protein [Clostridiales bacterium]|nr:phage holin family protein [Clostridiales bacterium]
MVFKKEGLENIMDTEKIWQTITAVLLAVAGGLARLLNMGGTKHLKRGKVLSELFISGFAGMMALMLARNFNLSVDWIGLICGCAGWLGPKMLDLTAKAAGKAVGVDIEGNDKKEI